VAYNMFRLAGILQGIMGRSRNGTVAARTQMEQVSVPGPGRSRLAAGREDPENKFVNAYRGGTQRTRRKGKRENMLELRHSLTDDPSRQICGDSGFPMSDLAFNPILLSSFCFTSASSAGKSLRLDK